MLETAEKEKLEKQQIDIPAFLYFLTITGVGKSAGKGGHAGTDLGKVGARAI